MYSVVWILFSISLSPLWPPQEPLSLSLKFKKFRSKSSDITNTNNPDSTRSNKEDNKKYLEEKYEQIVGFESEVEELGKIIENYRESKIAKEANRIEKRIKGAIETEKQKIGETTKSVKEKIEFVKKQQKEIKNLKVEECIKDMQNLEISNAKIEEFLRKKYSAAKDYEITKAELKKYWFLTF